MIYQRDEDESKNYKDYCGKGLQNTAHVKSSCIEVDNITKH